MKQLEPAACFSVHAAALGTAQNYTLAYAGTQTVDDWSTEKHLQSL
jgi:hypothetical protein